MRKVITRAALAVGFLGAVGFWGLSAVSGAGELETLDSLQTQRVHTGSVDLSRYATDSGKTREPSHDYHLELVEDDPISEVEPEPEYLPAFTHFSAFDNGDSLTNAYLCAFLSQEIYDPLPGVSEDWEEGFERKLMDAGAIDVELEYDATYGAEAAAVWLPNALIIVVRGSHWGGSEAFPLTDWIVDADDDAIEKQFDGFKCRVHEGVWNATNSVYNWVRTKALEAAAEGKPVWLTGHSLGGATATIAATRLHYVDDIPVQGLQTFGSFKVGDRDFKKILMEIPGADGTALGQFTQRWAVNGDFATTMFWRDWVWTKTKIGGFYVYYEHVGRTHQITRSGGLSYPDWEIDFDTEENRDMFALPDSLAPLGEHGDYYPALRNEIEKTMEGTDLEDVMEDLLQL